MNKRVEKRVEQEYELIVKRNNKIEKSFSPNSNQQIFDKFGNYSFPTEIKFRDLTKGTTNLNSIVFDQS